MSRMRPTHPWRSGTMYCNPSRASRWATTSSKRWGATASSAAQKYISPALMDGEVLWILRLAEHTQSQPLLWSSRQNKQEKEHIPGFHLHIKETKLHPRPYRQPTAKPGVKITRIQFHCSFSATRVLLIYFVRDHSEEEGTVCSAY